MSRPGGAGSKQVVMGLEDFKTEQGSSHSSSDSSSSSKRAIQSLRESNWVPKLDFSSPYVIVAENRDGHIYASKENLRVWEDPNHPARLEDNPDEDQRYRLLFKKETPQAWLRFCNLAQDQLGVDPNQLLEDDPEELEHIEEQVYYPPGGGPDSERECHICGVSSRSNESVMVELDLQKHRHVPVCSKHTIQELAEHGLLQ